MCTLALFWRSFERFPVVIAANRDENPQRPWSPPQLRENFFAGRDEVAGGTWLGINERGLTCGITNRWGPANDPSRKSRGLVVRDALRCDSARAAVELLSSRSPSETNAFGLLVADRHEAFRVDCDGVTIETQTLQAGVTVVANWGAKERRPRSDRALELAALVPRDSFENALPALRTLVSDHEGAEIPGQAICVHGDRYATVCSTLIATGDAIHWQDTRGNPCTATWTVRSPF